MTPARDDSEIQRDVLEELRADGRIRETDIGVLVHRSIVTLTGTVPTFAMKAVAEQLSHRVEGVLDVVDDIEVRIAGIGAPDDTQIALAVRQALASDPRLPHRHIHTTISRGIVTMFGDITTAAQADEAAMLLRRIRGVVGVLNRLDVTHAPIAAPDIEVAIRAAMQRHTQRELDELRIDAKDGTVTLGGFVHSWAERRAIVGTVRGIPGVQHVVDQLTVREPFYAS